MYGEKGGVNFRNKPAKISSPSYIFGNKAVIEIGSSK